MTSSPPRQFNIGALRFRADSRVVERRDGTVRLSYGEHVILLALCTTGVFRESPDSRLDNKIYRLRQKLGLEAQIMNDWKNGYRLLNATEVDA